MTDQVGETPHRLAKNSLGIAHIVFFVVAAAAPLTAVVGSTPAAFAFGNGAGVPGAFLLAGLLYLVFAVGFTAMSQHVGGAGAFYSLIAQGAGRPAGLAGAMLAMLTYTSIQIAIYGLIGVFTQAAFADLGINLPWWVWAFAFLVIVHLAGRRSIAFSGTILGACMIAEIAILLLLNVAIVLAGGGPEGITFNSFDPSVVLSPGLGVSLVFVVGSFIGFEATVIFSEEAENPRKTIPRATYIAVLLIAVFYAISTWAIIQFYGPSSVQQAAEANLAGFYFAAAEARLGGWSIGVINVLLITSLFACLLAFHNAINRYFFALGREGVAPKALSRVHAKHGSPHNAGILQSLSVAVVLLSFLVTNQDPYAVVFSYMAALGVIGILTVQVLVSVAIILFFRRDAHGLSVWTTLIAPSAGLAALLGALSLVVTNLELLAGTSNPLVNSFPFIVALVGLAGAAIALSLRRTNPQRYADLGKVFQQ